MPLSDPLYFGFLFAVFALVYIVRPGLPRLLVLLIASYFFYFRLTGYDATILIFETVVAYLGGLAVASHFTERQRTVRFAGCAIVLLMPLIIFKYLQFLLDAGAAALTGIGYSVQAPELGLALPVGISFFTFLLLGYLFNVFLDISEPERRPLRFALFASFFPLITAGPIERSTTFLPRLGMNAPFVCEPALAGLRQIFWGLVLKVIFADALVGKANLIFRWPGRYMPLEELFGVIFYAFYIYADFAGYSLIAIGSAKLLGLEVRPNFNQPYLSTSVPEFWRNWHISLASWVRDYVFAPLRTRWRRSRDWGLIGAVVLSFAILGLWHGAGWNYLIFGLMHGSFVAASIYTVAWRDKAWSSLSVPEWIVHIERILVTFSLVLLTLAIYGAHSLDDALTIYSDLFSREMLRNVGDGLNYWILGHEQPLIMTGINGDDFGWKLIALLVAGDILVRRRITLDRLPRVVQFFVYNGGIGLIVYHWAAATAAQPFLYYKF